MTAKAFAPVAAISDSERVDNGELDSSFICLILYDNTPYSMTPMFPVGAQHPVAQPLHGIPAHGAPAPTATAKPRIQGGRNEAAHSSPAAPHPALRALPFTNDHLRQLLRCSGILVATGPWSDGPGCERGLESSGFRIQNRACQWPTSGVDCRRSHAESELFRCGVAHRFGEAPVPNSPTFQPCASNHRRTTNAGSHAEDRTMGKNGYLT